MLPKPLDSSPENAGRIYGLEQHYFRAPDGTEHETAWWDDASEPAQLISADKPLELIGQIEGQDGRQSRYLSSQLNAWILRDYLSAYEAEQVQGEVATNPQFSDYWPNSSPTDKWEKTIYSHGGPADTSYIIKEITGKRMAFSIRDEADLSDVLQHGSAVVVGDETHSRLLCRVGTKPELLYVHDPSYSIYSGFFSFHRLSSLNKRPSVMVV
jgi:hypothetical protein